MGKRIKKISALILVIVMCFGLATASFAYVDSFPNTHRNTGQHIADLIAVARTQLGYTELSTKTGAPLTPNQNGGYTKYGASFGDPTGAWCAYFVSWCASHAGIPSSVVPRLGNCAATVKWYTARSRYCTRSSGYIPKTGDMIFFNFEGGSTAKHIGIVTGVSGNNVYTIEGNTGTTNGYKCCGKTRKLNSSAVLGYGVPNYNDATTYVGSYSFASYVSGKTVVQSKSFAYSTHKLSVITTTATNITSDSAVLNGEVQNGGGLLISAAGFYFGSEKELTKKYPVVTGSRKNKLAIELNVGEKIGKLKPHSTYYYKSYATIDGRDYVGPTYAVVTVNDKPQKLILSEESVNVGIGQTAEIMAAQLPIGSKDMGIQWKSADESIATVQDGIIKGVSYGNVVIMAKTKYGDVGAQCVANVLISTPQNLRLENTDEKKITVKWDKVDGAKGYIIYRSTSMDAKFEVYKKVGAGKTEFTDSNITPGERYYYRMETLAKDEKYNSDITDTLYTTARLAAPKNVYAANFLAASVRLTWDVNDEAKKYTVYRSENIDGLYTIIGSVVSNEFIDTDVKSGTDYFYKIIAENGNSRTASDYSEIVSVRISPIELGSVNINLPDITGDVTVQRNEQKISRNYSCAVGFAANS